MGPLGGGTGEGIGGPGEMATLLEATVIGMLVVSAVKVHRLERLEGLCCRIPLLSFLREPRTEGRLSKEVVSRTALGTWELRELQHLR